MEQTAEPAEYADFLARHSAQLQRVPKSLWRALARKLGAEVFDLSQVTQLVPLPAGRTNRTATYELQATAPIHAPAGGTEGINADSDDAIFLIDHMWTFASSMAREELLASPPLVERLKRLFVAAPEATSADGEQADGRADEAENGHARAEEEDDEAAHAMIRLVQEQGEGATHAQARDALVASGWQVVDAIQRLTRPDHAASMLEGIRDSLVPRIQERDPVEQILHCISQQNLAYQVSWKDSAGADKVTTLSFLMDEVGSSISHHPSQPTLAITNFLHVSGDGEVTPYTLAWPLRDIAVGDVLTRNFAAPYE